MAIVVRYAAAMKRLVVMACLSGSAVRAQPAAPAPPHDEPASDTGGFAAVRVGMQATLTPFSDTGKSPALEAELGTRRERWLAFSVAAGFTTFDDVDFDGDQELFHTSSRVFDARARVRFILDDPATSRRAGFFAGIGFGAIHTHRDARMEESRLGPLGEVFLGFDRELRQHLAFTFTADAALGAGLLTRVSAGLEFY